MPKAIGDDLDVPRCSLRIKKEGKFYERLLSRESSIATPSSRVYYADAVGTIPFVWESCPGTPINPVSSVNVFSPLTPPPSYQCTSTRRSSSKPGARLELNWQKRARKWTLLSSMLPKFNIRRYRNSASLPITLLPSPSSSSSSSNSVSTPTHHHRSLFSSWGSSSSLAKKEVCILDFELPVLCFGKGK